MEMEDGTAPSLAGRADPDTISELGKVVLQNEVRIPVIPVMPKP